MRGSARIGRLTGIQNADFFRRKMLDTCGPCPQISSRERDVRNIQLFDEDGGIDDPTEDSWPHAAIDNGPGKCRNGGNDALLGQMFRAAWRARMTIGRCARIGDESLLAKQMLERTGREACRVSERSAQDYNFVQPNVVPAEGSTRPLLESPEHD